MSEPAKPGWWGRNRRLVVPFSCLMLILFCGGYLALLFKFGADPSDDIYKGALAKAKASPEVTAAIGSPITPDPIKPGRWGGVKLEGLSMGYVAIPSPIKTHAVIDIPITGPKGSGTIQGHAFKSDGKWYFSSLTVHVATGDGPFRLLERDEQTGDFAPSIVKEP